MNEGCATYVHYQIMNRLHEKGLITDGTMLEFLRSHTNVVFQPDFDDPRYLRHQPLRARLRHDAATSSASAPSRPTRTASGSPTSPATATRWRCCATSGRTTATRASSCSILSPRLIRDFGLFHVLRRRRGAAPGGRGDPRRARLPQDPARAGAAVRRRPGPLPDIQVVDVDLAGDRRLILHHRALNRVLLDEKDARQVLQHLADLWGYDVLLKEIDPASDDGAEGACRGAAPRPGASDLTRPPSRARRRLCPGARDAA